MTDTIPKQASAFRTGGYIVLKDRPCKIASMSTHKTGKHGHAKINFIGFDIFNKKKIEVLQSSTHNMQEPVVVKSYWDLISIEGDECELQSMDGSDSKTLSMPPDDMGKKLTVAFEADEIVVCEVTASMGLIAILAFKIENM